MEVRKEEVGRRKVEDEHMNSSFKSEDLRSTKNHMDRRSLKTQRCYAEILINRPWDWAFGSDFRDRKVIGIMKREYGGKDPLREICRSSRGF